MNFQIQKVVDDITEVKQEVQHCGKGVKSVACYAKLIVRISKDIVTAPVAITNDVKTVTVTVEEVVPELEACGTETVADCSTRGGVLLAKIDACVAQKMKH